MTETPPKPIEFELYWRRRKDARREAPDEPAGFRPLRGDLPTVTKEANRLNSVQANSGLKDFFFFPDVAGDHRDRTHCDACKRLAAREAADDGLEL